MTPDFGLPISFSASPGSKLRISSHERSPGGQIATALSACAALGLKTSYVGTVSTDHNGDFIRGLFWLIVTPGFWIGKGGLFGWVCHVIAGITAYRRAERKNAEAALPFP